MPGASRYLRRVRFAARRAPARRALSSEGGFDAAATEKAIGALQRETRSALGGADVAGALEASGALVRLAEESYGSARNPILASACNDAALAKKAAGDFEGAAALLARAAQLYEACGMRDHASSAVALHNLGACYKAHAASPGVTAFARVTGMVATGPSGQSPARA